MGFSETKLGFIRSLIKEINESNMDDIVSVVSQTLPWVPPGTTECFIVEDIHIRIVRDDGAGLSVDGEEPYVAGGEVAGFYQ